MGRQKNEDDAASDLVPFISSVVDADGNLFKEVFANIKKWKKDIIASWKICGDHAQVDTTCKKVDSVTCYFLFICCR